jgi:hypothetical protein
MAVDAALSKPSLDGGAADADAIDWDLLYPGAAGPYDDASRRPGHLEVRTLKHRPRAAELLASMQERWRLCFHEAGHAVAFLALGVEVTRIEVHDAGAFCRAADPYRPIALLAGAEAARMAGFPEDAPSDKDVELLNQARANLGHTASIYGPREEATRMVLREWPVVVALARRLELSGSLNGRQVVRVVAEARSEAESRQLQGLPAIEDEGDWL